MTTERIRSSPTAMLWISAETLVRRSTFRRTASDERPPARRQGSCPTAEDADAAQEDHRDDGQGHALADVGPGAHEAGGQDDAGQARRSPVKAKRLILIRATRTPEIPRGARVLADGVDLPPDPRPVQDDGQHDGQGDEDDERPRDRRPGHGAEAERSVNHSGKPLTPCGPSTISARPRKRASVPSVTTSDGRPTARDQQAVEQAAEDADEEDDRDPDLERHAGREQEAEQSAREARHRLDREVDLAER